MYKQLDEYLNDFAISDDSAILNYWYDNAFEDAIDMIDNFNEEDWKLLKQELSNKNDAWKERLVYCLTDNTNINQLEILQQLSYTDNINLFSLIIDALRTNFDISSIKNMDYLINKINEVSSSVDTMTRDMFLDFLKKKV